MPTQQFNNYANLITFTRASSGTALRPISYGPELVVNGDFASATGWILGAGVTISGGVANLAAGSLWLEQAIPTQAGRLYTVTATAAGVNGSFCGAWDNINQNTNLLLWGGGSSAAGRSATFSFTFVANDTTSYIAFIGGGGAATTIDNVSVRQLNLDQAGDPLTLFNHPNNVPRIEYDANRNRLGLLIEEARTNLLPYSEDITNAVWGKSGLTVTSDQTAAPSGAITADKVEITTPGAYRGLTQTVSANPAELYAFTIYLKAGTHRYVEVGLQSRNSGNFVNVIAATRNDLSNGAQIAAPLGDHSVIDFNNGWYKFSLKGAVAAASNQVFPTITFLDAAGLPAPAINVPAGSNVFAWGAQLELGAFPTSYIPTTGAAATRAVDIASIPTSAFGYNTTAGTFVARVNQPLANRVGARRYIWNISDNGNNRLSGRASDTGSVEPAWAYGTGVAVENIVIPVTTGPSHSTALAYSSQNGIAALNGTLSTLRAGYVGVPQPTLNIGQSGIQQICGHITSLQYYPRQLSPAQIQELTR